MEYDRFERIENDRLRVICVRFEPDADFAPGDTLVGKAYFAGDTVVSVEDFSIAYLHQYDQNHSFPDERTITLIDSTLWLPDSMQFRYKIPEDVFLKEKVQGDVDSATIKRIVDVFSLYDGPLESLPDIIGVATLDSLLLVISNIYARPSIFFNAHSTSGSVLKVRSEFIVRYNTLLSPYLPVNHNPIIKWMNVYKVPYKSADSFNPNKLKLREKYFLTYLYNTDTPESVSTTIEIDTGFAYFISCNKGIETYVTSSGDTIKDTTCDIVNSLSGKPLPEEYEYKWFFQNSDNVDEEPDSLLLLNFGDSGPGYIRMKLPVFTDMKHFKIWVVVHDNAPEEWSRPKGYTMCTVEGSFEYTDAYVKSVK